MRTFGLQKMQVQFSLLSDVIPVNHFHNKQVQHGDFHQVSKSHFYLRIQECCFFFITPDKSKKLILVALKSLVNDYVLQTWRALNLSSNKTARTHGIISELYLKLLDFNLLVEVSVRTKMNKNCCR